MKTIRIATRKSKLALFQANLVKTQLEKKYPEYKIILSEIITDGDRYDTAPLTDIGGKSNFVKALQSELLNEKADIAVHSIKDMSATETEELVLAAVLKREDARDVFIANRFSNFSALPHHAVIGTASPRRTCLVNALRPDLTIKLIRGNVDTRLLKLTHKEFDGIVLAAAGLIRLGLSSRISSYFEDDFFTPAIGQGAIGVECRSNDHATRKLVKFLNHIETEHCVMAERAVNQVLNGDCHTAIGAHAKIFHGKMHLAAMVGSLDGKNILREKMQGDYQHAKELGIAVGNALLAKGATEIIHHA